MVMRAVEPTGRYSRNKFLLSCIAALLFCWGTVESSNREYDSDELASRSYSSRGLSKVRCRDVVVETDVPRIRVTDEVWKKASSNLQSLVSCLPDEKGGVLEFNVTQIITPSEPIFFEQGPVTITSIGSRTSGGDAGDESVNKVVISCPDLRTNTPFMEISGSKVILDNIVIDGCKPSSDQPVIAVDNNTDLVISNSELRNVNPSPSSGVPAIRVDSGANLEIIGSTFRNINGIGVLGIVKKASAVIRNSKFMDNSALGNGGVIHADSAKLVQVKKSTFLNNSASLNGGAIYVTETALQVEKSEFTSNTGENGGAISFQVGVSPTNITLEVSKSTFAKNTVKDNGGSLQVSGAIQAQVIDIKIEKSTASSGGAMWVDGTGSLEMEDVQLMQNTASKDGGGAVLNTDGGPLKATLKLARLTENSAERGGGLLLGNSVDLDILGDVSCVQNTAKEQGGAVRVGDSSSISGTGALFKQNDAGQGGAIYIKSGGSPGSRAVVTLEASEFLLNSARDVGGGIAMEGANATCKLGPNVNFDENKASSGGGIAALEASHLDIFDSMFARNSANELGGALFTQGLMIDVDLQALRSTFTENKSGRGGAVYVEGPKTTASFNEIAFTKNEALDSGGGLVILDGPTAALTNLNFVGNTAKANGGGVLIEAVSKPTVVEVMESTFNDNIARDGGGIYSTAEKKSQNLVDIKLSTAVTFSSNIAFEHGGGIAMRNQGTLKLSGSTFDNNNATISGGAAYIQGGKKTIIILEDTSFTSNSASFGGAIDLSDGAQCQLLKNVQYTRNTANQGGALHLSEEGTSVDARSTEFIQNQAAYGGAIYASGASVLKMSKANFEGNTAIVSEMISGKLGLAGGALFSTGSVQIQLDSSDFFKNEAESSGGAMAIHVNASDRRAPGILLRGVEFRSNAAGDLGGAIAVQGDESLNLNMDIIQSTFIKNTADQGGAVWINRGVQSITVDGAKVKENSARIQAGGIGIRNVPQCVIKDVIATENRAGTYGGALSLECDLKEKDCKAEVSSTEFNANEVRDSGITEELPCSGITPDLIPDADTPGGGGISASGDSLSLEINRGSTFKDNVAKEGGAIHLLHARKVSILNTTLEGNRAMYGGAVSAHGPTNRIRMTSSLISRNEACVGGALHLWDIVPKMTLLPPVWIQNMVFEENSAQVAGGAVFIDDVQNAGVCCSCEDETSGSDLMPLNETVVSYIRSECNGSWTGNQVKGSGHGRIFASQAVELRLSPKSIDDHLSGTFLPKVKISYVDFYGQPVPAPGVLVKVSGDQMTLRGQTLSDMFSGATSFDGTIVQAPHGTYNLTYTFSSWEGQMDIPSVRVQIHISSCQFGEFTGNDGTSCQQCPKGTFNFGESVTDCRECPKHAVCNGSLLVPDQGYWHSAVYSTQMHKCLGWKACSWEGREEKLLETNAALVASSSSTARRKILDTIIDSDYLRGQCKQGYEGPVCGSCSEDHARIRSNKCVKCKEPLGYLLAAIFLVLWFLVLVGSLTHHGWKLGVVRIHRMYDSESETDGINPHPEPYEAANSLKLKRLPRNSTRSEITVEKKKEPASSSEKEAIYPNLSPGPSLSSLSNCSRCEIEADVGSSTNPPDTLSRVSSVNNHSDLKHIKISMDGELKPQISLTRSHIEGKTADIDLFNGAKNGRPSGEDEEAEHRRGLPFEVIKIIVNFMQATSLAAFINTDWTDAIMKTFQVQDLAGAGGDSILPFSCASDSSTPLQRNAITAVYPVVIAAVVVCFWLFARCFCQSTLSTLWDRWVLSIAVILYIGYTNITRRSLEFLNCINIDDKGKVEENLTPARFWAEGRHWAEDTSVKCFEGTHNQLTKALALPLLVLVTAGLPLMIVTVLLFNRKKLQDLSLLRKYGFVYECYRKEWNLWEVTIFIRKALLACLMAFTYSLEPELQSILAMAVLMVSLFVHLWVWPYRENCRSFNQMEALSLFASAMAFYNVLLIENRNVDKLVGDIFSIVLVVCIVLVTLYMLYELVKELVIGLDWELERKGVRINGNQSTSSKIWLLYRMRMNAFTHNSRSRLRNIVNCFPGCGCC